MEGNMNKPRFSRCTTLSWIALSALLAGIVLYPAPAEAQQQNTVTGTVTSAQNGQPLPGVAVGVVGGSGGALTDAAGRYSIRAPANASLAFSLIGYAPTQVEIAGRTTVDVQLAASAVKLDELVVTGYQTQRRADITSAIATVNTESLERQASSSVLQRLAGRAPGVTVTTSGSPGARSTVRIRGISSFGNNDPLYIIDGTPVEESYANFLNPQDIESVQVLKDASAASIYGARASNGVIIITTKKGTRGAPQVQVDVNYGLATPTRGYDDFLILNSLDYAQVQRIAYQNAGLPVPTNIYGNDPNNPTLPAYIWPNNGTDQTGDTINVANYSYPNNLIMPASAGTNWWDAVFGTGQVRDANVAVRGGGENQRYSVGFGYFDQQGTAIGNRYTRGTGRVNTDFTAGKLTIGENLTVALEESYGGQGGDSFGEGGIIGKNILSQPIVPVYDINGNFASGKAVNLGNNTNPVKDALNGTNNRNTNTRIFGNAFARLAITDRLMANTSLGINSGGSTFHGYAYPTPENSEPTFNNSINQNMNTFWNYTWTNTLNYQRAFGPNNVTLLAGQEAIKGRSRYIGGNINNLVSLDPNSWYIQDALGDPSTKNVNSSGGVNTLLSFFGKADYNYQGRYYLSGTLRRDGSSRLGPSNRWGTFPAFSLGWRVSDEGFLKDNSVISNLMLHGSWGVTGNQNIPSGRINSVFGGGTGDTFYDITGGNALAPGYRETVIGNENLKWEENKSTNIGLDLDLFDGSVALVFDVYRRDTDNLLYNPPIPGTQGQASAPFVNIGAMRNTGFDGSLSFNGTLASDLQWNLNLNGSHYSNEIVRIDGKLTEFFGPVTTRYASQGVTMNRVGFPIGSFYGYKNVGYFSDAAEIAELDAQAKAATGRSDAVYQNGAAPGRLRWADTNGDGVITPLDRTIIGSPHPDFTGGVNLGLNWKNFDLGMDVFGTFGNEIWDTQKEFYVFRNFNTNVRRDRLTDSWDPSKSAQENANAKYPILDQNDLASRDPSDFYLEDGSYVRLRSLQIGYTVPRGRFAGFDNVRVYIRGENLFTITGYDGLDPALPALNVSRSGVDARDMAMGIDRGTYPSNRTVSVGFGVGF
jgi:TonB-linked SusC/RagA family outer membrane protein